MAVQIIESNRPKSTSERFGEAFASLGQTAGEIIPQHLKGREEFNALKSRYGEDVAKMNPAFQKFAIEQQEKKRMDAMQMAGELQETEQGYQKIKELFGTKFADVWKSSPTGGRTALLQHALQEAGRGANIDEILSNINPELEQTREDYALEIPEHLPQLKEGKIPKDFEWPDFSQRPKGYSKKEWIDEKSEWRKENAPIFKENKDKLVAAKRDSLGIRKLKGLNESKKLPEDFQRVLINPETGEIYELAQLAGLASPEAQEWVKELARFANRAKDAFGSRVTNFDLQQYMKQFPSLLNTKEGRARVLKMMDINNKLDSLYENSLKSVYEKYGLSGISQEKAEELARGFISEETNRLENEFLGIYSEAESEANENVLTVIGPDGQEYEMDKEYLDQLPEGYRIK